MTGTTTDPPVDGSDEADLASRRDREHLGATFWVGLVIGGSIMAYAVWGAVQAFSVDEQVGLARWLAGSAVLHDAVLAPIVTVGGLLLAWILPRPARGPILGAAAMSGIVVLFSWPALRGYGRRAANPSLLPHDYGRNVAVVLGAIWAVAVALVVVRVVREKRR